MRVRKVIIIFSGLLLLTGFGSFAYSYYKVNSIPKFKKIKSEQSTSNYESYNKDQDAFLIFTTGSNGLSPEDGVRLNLGKYRASMQDNLTDTMMLVLINYRDKKISTLSLNRDIYMESTGNRINTAYERGGVEELVNEVYEITGVRANHQIKINFAGFADLTDALGGVDLYIPYRVYDKYAKLQIDNPGCVHFEGKDALAFARSRHWSTSLDGINYGADNTSSDFGRIERQQSIARALIGKSLNPTLITKIPTLLNVAGNSLTVDEDLNTNKLISIARNFANGVNGLYASTTTSYGRTINKMSVTIPDQFKIYATVKSLADKAGYKLDNDWPGKDMIGSKPVEGSIDSSTAEVNNSQDYTSKNFKPDHGLGNGGLTFKPCTNGHNLSGSIV